MTAERRPFLRRAKNKLRETFLPQPFTTAKMRSQWTAVKGAYKGRRAFLLGNGPSLNLTPLHLLRDDHCLLFNRANLLFDRLPFTPSMYMCVDERVAKDMSTEINAFKDRFDHAFFPNIHPSSIDFRRFIKDGPNVLWLHLNWDGFFTDLPQVGLGGTVANVGLQVLAFLGFSPIYIVGVDMDYAKPEGTVAKNARDWTATKDNDCNHFDPRYFGAGRKYHYPRVEESMLPSMYRAHKIAADLHIQIFNAGYGGKLEAFDRVDFRALFHTAPTEEVQIILDHACLEGLGSTLPDALPNAPRLSSPAHWNAEHEAVIARSDIALQVFPSALITHTPLGPVDDSYLFVRRERIRARA